VAFSFALFPLPGIEEVILGQATTTKGGQYAEVAGTLPKGRPKALRIAATGSDHKLHFIA
jgi:hypothetical protein